jgi:hypothetical protein
MDQLANQEEEARGFEEKGRLAVLPSKLLANRLSSITMTMDEAHLAEESLRSVTTRMITKLRRELVSLWKVDSPHIIVDI